MSAATSDSRGAEIGRGRRLCFRDVEVTGGRAGAVAHALVTYKLG